jgi:hypothetical protein
MKFKNYNNNNNTETTHGCAKDYQYKFYEIITGDLLFDNYVDNSPNNQKVLEIRDQLFQRILELMKLLSLYHRMVLHMYFLENKTTTEIAHEFSNSQTNIHKLLWGCWGNPGKTIKGGRGIVNKLAKIAAKDIYTQYLLEQIDLYS